MTSRLSLLWLFFGALGLALSGGCSPNLSTSDEVQALKHDMALERAGASTSFASQTSIETCRTWCDPNNPDYRCFFAGRLNDGRDKQIRDLIARFLQPQPVSLAHLELMRMFEVNDPDFEDAREATELKSDVLSNKGTASTLTAETQDRLTVRAIVPRSISYAFKRDGAGFQLHSTDDNQSFFLDISDPVLQRTYGGLVRAIDVRADRILFAAPLGCVAYDPAPQLNNGSVATAYATILARRLMAERTAGASANRIQSVRTAYARATFLKDSNCKPDECPESCPVNQLPCKYPSGVITCATWNDCYNWGGGKMCGT